MRALLLYDGDCGVCTRLARFAERWLRPGVEISAYQDAELAPLGLTPARCEAALQLVDGSGRVFSAQDAVARLLLASTRWWRPLGAALLMPGANATASLVYRWVAANRARLPGGTPACQLPAAERPGTAGRRQS